MARIIGITLLLCLLPFAEAFYVPGVAPKEFKDGESIEVKAIKLTSIKGLIPYEYYSLPFCKPKDGNLHYKSESLGEVMRGDRIVNTPYEVFMRREAKCSQLCSPAGKALSISAEDSTLLRQRIADDYHVHLLVDNLPCATKYLIPETEEAFFDHGYRLGWMDGEKVILNNHLQITLKYHEPVAGVYRVVGFEVQPQSIHSSSYSLSAATDGKGCSLSGENNKVQELVEGTNEVVWSYSVQWEQSDIPWASRWDNYLKMKDTQIHWFSILNSIVVIVCLAGFISVIIMRTIHRDISLYNKAEDVEDTMEESGWKLVHGDVFRPPRYCMLLVNLVGTGIQLIGMASVTISFAMLGMLSPSSRGSLTTVAIFLYCCPFSVVAGYYSGRLYKTLRGQHPKRMAIRTALLFPGIVLGTGFFLNFFLIGKHSSGAVPITTMLALLTLLLCIVVPLVLFGSHFGYRKKPWEQPVRTNQIPRQVPEQPWYLNTLPCMLMAGVLPFGAVFIELYFILSAIWQEQFYYLFGFLFVVLAILYVSCALIAVVVTYFLLCAENYHWWWNSFAISGGSAIYVMAYSTFYFYTKLDISGGVPMLLYFTYSLLIAFTFWIITGTVGFFSAYLAIRKIYSAVKID